MNLPITHWINRKRIWTLVSIAIIVPIGFYTKFYSGPAAHWVNDSLGGVFYVVFWCLLVFFFYQKGNPLHIAVTVLFITCILEFLQLWHPPFLEGMRGFFIGGVILGTTFSWWDFPYYFVGASIGWFWISKLNKLQ